MSALLWFYFFSLLLLVGGFTAIVTLLKKLKVRLHGGMFFLGVIVAVAVFVAIFFLFRLTFKTDNYYNTPFFRTLVGFVFLALLALVRQLIVRGIFFRSYREDAGCSFCFGFGAAPGLFMGIYLLIMFLVVAFNGLFNGPCEVAEEGYLTFADNTIISAFHPAAGHLSFSIAFFAFAVLTLFAGLLFQKLEETRCSILVTVVWFVLPLLLEAGAILPFPFFAMYQLKHWEIAVWIGVLALAQVALALFIPKKKEESTYTKQFE